MKLGPGLTFSWRRAAGLTRLQTKASKTIGVPLSKAGRERKLGRIILDFIFGRRH